VVHEKKKNIYIYIAEANSFSLALPKCNCIRVKVNGMVAQEYLQKQDGSTDLNVKNKRNND